MACGTYSLRSDSSRYRAAARGRRYPVIRPYAGQSNGIIPAPDNAKPSRIASSGADRSLPTWV